MPRVKDGAVSKGAHGLLVRNPHQYENHPLSVETKAMVIPIFM